MYECIAVLGIQTVAIYSEQDDVSLRRFKVDEAYLVGEGMRIVRHPDELQDSFDRARSEAKSAFGDGSVRSNGDIRRLSRWPRAYSSPRSSVAKFVRLR